MSVTEIQLFQKELVTFVKSEVKAEFDNRREILTTKEDLANVRADLMRSIYIVGLVQFLAIVGSVLTIFNFMLK